MINYGDFTVSLCTKIEYSISILHRGTESFEILIEMHDEQETFIQTNLLTGHSNRRTNERIESVNKFKITGLKAIFIYLYKKREENSIQKFYHRVGLAFLGSSLNFFGRKVKSF